MLQGFIPDFAHAATLLAKWHAGIPRKSFWGNIKASHAGGVPIGAFRCSRCGLLELYADDRFSSKK